ncbi:hypothetical protein A5906_30615 [Bradyrhizobium sacchari]|nr:hypothetical protein A5906_30615 [Bradyrhizobium sacchari]
MRVHFHRCVALNSLSFVKGGWPKPPDEFTRTHIQRFGDAIDEIDERGLDRRELSPKLMSPAELAKAYLGLPKELVEMLSPANYRAWFSVFSIGWQAER